MEIKEELVIGLKNSIKDLFDLDLEPEIVLSSDLSKGDFTTNIALRLNKGNPKEVAEKIIEALKQGSLSSKFEKIEVAGPGFINFYLSKDSLLDILIHLDIAKNTDLPDLVFEFGDPNPFKIPHIGHLRNFILGESLSRLFEASGRKVIRANYQGDVGMHVAKAIWGMLDLNWHEFEHVSLEERGQFLGKAYAQGAQKFENDEVAKKEITDINKKVYLGDPEVISIWEKGRTWSLEYFEILYKLIGIKYEKYYFESETAPKGLKIVRNNTPEVFEESDGAVVYRGDEEGLHTRVFINSEGNPTYEAKDLALAVMKAEDFPEADSLVMTANEQIEYFRVMIAALSKIDSSIGEKTRHMSFGFVNLKEGKMSSRSGNVISAFWLIERVEKKLKENFPDVDERTLGQISVGAVKWGMLKFSRESNIAFSIDESISIEGNSGPYMQYAYARTQSILEKSGKTNFEAKSREKFDDKMLALIRFLCQYPYILETSIKTFSPNLLTNYLFELAQNFSSFYESKKIIGATDEEERLFLVERVGYVLENGLNLLGIETPKKI